LEREQINGEYWDPILSNKNENFVRIKNKYKDQFWKLSDREMLLLISIWVRNKEWEGDNGEISPRQYRITNDEWRTLIIDGEEFQIAEKNNYRVMKKFEKMGIIEVEGQKNERKFFYDFGKEEKKGFFNIPLEKIKHYLQTFGIKNIRTYIYMLFEIYNSPNNTKSSSNWGVRGISISKPEIAKKLGMGKTTAYRHVKKLINNGFLKSEKNDGRKNRYYIPVFYRKKDDRKIYYDTKSKKQVRVEQIGMENTDTNKNNRNEKYYEYIDEKGNYYSGTKKELMAKCRISERQWRDEYLTTIVPYQQNERKVI